MSFTLTDDVSKLTRLRIFAISSLLIVPLPSASKQLNISRNSKRNRKKERKITFLCGL